MTLTHARKIGSIAWNTILGNSCVYRLIGFWNKVVLHQPIKTVFLLYPANEKYIQAYVYSWYARKYKWSPALLGFFKQNNGWGLTFGISATEKDFRNDANREQIRILEHSMENIRRMIGARQKSFAGILPGLLVSRGIVDDPVESRTTAKAVLQAIRIARDREKFGENIDVIILGASGFVGSLIVEALTDTGYRGAVHCVDIWNSHEFKALCDRLRGKPAILLNATKRGALREYIPLLWPEVVMLNEVYPEPSPEELNLLRGLGVHCYHIVGVEGKAWPSFPRAYAGGIPCCASFLPEEERDYRIIIERKS